MTETGNTVERLRDELNYGGKNDWEYISPRADDVRAVLAVVEAAQEEENAFSTRQRVAARQRKIKALAALHSQASDEGKPE